jgi:hypothetical protein
MSEEQVVRVGRRHRSEFAIKQLVEEFVSSGFPSPWNLLD